MSNLELNDTYDQVLKAKEELSSIKDSKLLSSQSYEIIDKLLDLTLVDINIKKMQIRK